MKTKYYIGSVSRDIRVVMNGKVEFVDAVNALPISTIDSLENITMANNLHQKKTFHFVQLDITCAMMEFCNALNARELTYHKINHGGYIEITSRGHLSQRYSQPMKSAIIMNVLKSVEMVHTLTGNGL